MFENFNKEKKSDLIISGLLIVFLVFAYLRTYFFSKMATWGLSVNNNGANLTPSTWPRIVLIVLILLTLLLIVKTVMECRVICESETTKISKNGLKNGAVFLALVFVYLFSMEYLGFLISTLMLGVLIVAFMGKTELKFWKGTSLTVMISILIVLSFTRFLYLPLPRGQWIFRKISEFVLF